jgi:hypothetical protein
MRNLNQIIVLCLISRIQKIPFDLQKICIEQHKIIMIARRMHISTQKSKVKIIYIVQEQNKMRSIERKKV